VGPGKKSLTQSEQRKTVEWNHAKKRNAKVQRGKGAKKNRKIFTKERKAALAVLCAFATLCETAFPIHQEEEP
jgi:hypothetical protein